MGGRPLLWVPACGSEELCEKKHEFKLRALTAVSSTNTIASLGADPVGGAGSRKAPRASFPPRKIARMAAEEGPRAFAKAYQITSRAVSASIGMIVPGLLGWWADTRLGTLPVITSLGFAFGLAYGVWRLTKLQADSDLKSAPSRESDGESHRE